MPRKTPSKILGIQYLERDEELYSVHFWARKFGNKKWRESRKSYNDLGLTTRPALKRWSGDPEKRHEKDVLIMLKALDVMGLR